MAHPAQQLAAAGFHLDLLPGGKIKVEPVKLLTREWVSFVRAHRSELIGALMAVEAANDGPPPAAAKDPYAACWPWEATDLRGGQP